MHGCDESELSSIALKLAQELKPGDRVLLEGPMGVGKTTFAQHLLRALGVDRPPEGSPTFAIAHEYPGAGVVHMDFYRIKSEAEIEEAGIHSYFWERPLIVITEWLSSWPGFEEAVKKSGPLWIVNLSFTDRDDQRDIQIEQITSKKSKV